MLRLPEHHASERCASGVFLKTFTPDAPIEPLRYVHRDDYWVFGVVERGECLIGIDFRDWRCRAGKAMVVLPGQVHAFRHGESLDAMLLFVDASYVPREVQLRFAEWARQPAPIPLPAAGREELHRLRLLLEECSADGSDSSCRRLALRHLALAAAALLCDAVTEVRPAAGADRRPAELTAAFRELLASELCRHRSPSYYAGRLHVSRSYLCEAVRQTTGLSPSRIIRDEVVLRAKRMLVYSTRSVQQIASELGFDDCAYFSRLFTRAASLSPSAFRAKYLE